jgi:hypothetical protein
MAKIRPNLVTLSQDVSEAKTQALNSKVETHVRPHVFTWRTYVGTQRIPNLKKKFLNTFIFLKYTL